MADVEHSTITDPNIHEPKGAAAAAAGKVYVSDGGGSGAWTATTAIDIPHTTDYLMQLYHTFADPANDYETLTDSTWIKRELNTQAANTISGASLASSVVTLPAGTYLATFTAPCAVYNGNTVGTILASGSPYTGLFKMGVCTSRLRNTTDGSNLLISAPGYCLTPALFGYAPIAGYEYQGVVNMAIGVFTLAGAKNIELQSYIDAGFAGFWQSYTEPTEASYASSLTFLKFA